MNTSSKGTIALLFAAFMYGTWGVLSRFLGQNFDLFFQMWTRYLFLSVMLFIIMVARGSWKTIGKDNMRWFFIRIGAGFITVLTIYLAFNNIAIGISYFGSYTGTLVGGYVIGSLFLGEKITKIKLTSLIFSLLGVYIIYSFNPVQINFYYFVLALLSGFAYATWYSTSKKLSDKYSNIQLVFIDFTAGFFLAFLLSALLKEQWIVPSLTLPWLVNFVFALTSVSSGILLIYGFKYISIQVGSMILLTEILFGIVLGYLFFSEAVTMSTFLGGGIILSSVALSLYTSKDR
ncbi:hypothetical protein A3F34_01595 [Candidatus Roizmanbacteria bacterium RIFCSPHIGHO2_12_FULL_44_10]|uniref:EamA domain-containing protein n=1 Tax=Candidatus Roizmanbacteria bacterium RIFCSPHIGHO2_12_FULL_44_10 TaxID=1802054 RepID=A0A1F7I5J5_9BACT|nr:MAG: hypothetical protein A3F34_01595 [Candidatus Roizmanbacteria bacterium RIFCSPHIGHO2_12_FULL_44_10]